MRVIKYPPPEEEAEIACPYCLAILAYTQSDCQYRPGVGGETKVIFCPVCDEMIRLLWIPYGGETPRTPKKLDITW